MTTSTSKKNIAAAAKADAVKAEATGERVEPIDVVVNINGEDVTLQCPPSIEDAPIDVVLFIEEEKPISAFKALAGAEGMQELRNAGATVKDFTAFIEAWQEAAGLGNS